MATGLLQNQTWNVGKAGKLCAACQTELNAGRPIRLMNTRILPTAGFATLLIKMGTFIQANVPTLVGTGRLRLYWCTWKTARVAKLADAPA